MKKNHNAVFIILAILIMGGVGTWYYFYWEGSNYFKTENAKVTASLYTVLAPNSGKLIKLNISQGSYVEENEVIARAENGPYIKSPIKGQVVKSDVTLNQVVSPTTVVAVIADTNNIYVNANIEETDIRKIKRGQEVEVQLDAYPGKKFKGHVEDVNSVTQTAISGNTLSFSTSGTYTKVTQLIPVKILIDQDVDLSGLIGTNSTVKIKLR